MVTLLCNLYYVRADSTASTLMGSPPATPPGLTLTEDSWSIVEARSWMSPGRAPSNPGGTASRDEDRNYIHAGVFNLLSRLVSAEMRPTRPHERQTIVVDGLPGGSSLRRHGPVNLTI